MTGITLFLAVLVLRPVLVSTSAPATASLPPEDERTTPEPEPRLTLLFSGDIMLARGVEWRIGKEGNDYPLGNVDEVIAAADIAVGNFEGTIRETPTIEPAGSFAFDTTADIAGILKTAGFDVMSLANNHGDDFGNATTTFTRATLEALGILTFGDPADSSSYVLRTEQNGFALSFVGYHAILENIEPVVAAVAAERAAGRFVIVFPHWGPEYQSVPHTSAQVEPAHRLVDAGADLVVGAHPHVIQSIETYNGIPIIYSLGNFLFDQDWSLPTQQGMVASVTLTAGDIRLDFSTVQVTQQQTTAHDAAASADLLATYDIPTSLTLPRTR